MSVSNVPNIDLRERMVALLADYKVKMTRWQILLLEREIERKNTEFDKPKDERNSADEQEILDLIVIRLWGYASNCYPKFEAKKTEDLFQHLPIESTWDYDYSPDTHAEALLKLEAGLNEYVPDKYRPITIPEDFKIFSSLVGGLLGFENFGGECGNPYWYGLSFGISTRVETVEEILQGLNEPLDNESNGIICGWRMGSKDPGNVLYAVYWREQGWDNKQKRYRRRGVPVWRYVESNYEVPATWGKKYKSVEELVAGWLKKQGSGIPYIPPSWYI